MHKRLFLNAIAAACTTTSPWVLGQGQYPEQIVKWVVPYPAGGGTDNLARSLAESMRASMGQQVIIDNRPGAATNIGGEHVARAPANGYTILSADNAILAFNEHLFSKLTFRPDKDFSYIGAIGKFPLVLVVPPSFAAQNFKDFLAYVKANPGKVNYASVGNGSPHHLAMELFKNRTGASITHVPYRGAAPAMQDLMGGQVPVMYLDLASGMSIIKAGKVKPLAIGSTTRSPLLPDVPTLAESGISNAEVFAFQGLLGPAGLPAPIIARLNQELNQALADPVVLKRFAEFGFEPLRGTPEEFRRLARSESARWGEVIRANKISLD